MSASKRRRISLEEEDSSGSEEEILSENEEEHQLDELTGEEEIELDFEGRNPADKDCYGIQQLMEKVFLKAHINSRKMAEVIIDQQNIGSVILQCAPEEVECESGDDDMSEDDIIFGITSVINISVKRHISCIKEFHSFVLQKAQSHATPSVIEYFRDILDNEAIQVGYLINERYINIPFDVAVPALENLNKEITAAIEKGRPYKFDYYLMIIKFHRKETRVGRPHEDVYTNSEEEIFAEHSNNSFEYSVEDECDSGLSGDWMEEDGAMIPYRKIIVFEGKKFPDIILEIAKHLKEK